MGLSFCFPGYLRTCSPTSEGWRWLKLMEVLCWITVLVLGCFGEPPNQAFPGEAGNFGVVSVTFSSDFHLGGASTKAGVICAPAGAIWFALLHYSWWKKRHLGKKREVISARFADAQMLGDFLSDSGKRCGNVLFSEVRDKPVT